MMQITFTGDAAEVRQEMLELLGLARSEPAPVVEQTVDQQVEAAFGETKRGRGRPKKTEVADPAPVEATPEASAAEAAPIVEPTPEPTPEPAPEPAPEPVVEPEPTPEPEPVAEQPGLPVPSNAQDLMNAAMEIVKGDSGKKIALVKLLQSYGAKTINTLGAEHYPEFWVKVNEL